MPAPARVAGVGAFVVTGLVLFTIGLFMIGDRQMAFAKKFTVYTEFARVTGLQTGAIVRVSGAKAGSVREILPPNRPSDKFKVKLEIAEELHPLVRTDSIATIETEGLVGGSFLNIATGTDQAPQAPENSTIAGKEPFAIADLLMQTNETIKKVNETIEVLKVDVQRTIQSIGETITAVSDTVANANQLIDDVKDDVKTIASAGTRITQDAAHIADSIRNGEGTIGKLLNDDELYKRFAAIAKNADEIASNAREVVEQTRKTLGELTAKNGPIQGVTASMKKTMDEASLAMAGFAENMEALKRNFLVRGFFNDRGYFNLADISPARYRQGALLKDGQRGVVRVWLGALVLFEADPDDEGAERLTDTGRARAESAIEPYLSYLGDGVLVVEGYAQKGTRDEQFLRSRLRAAVVRDYLIGKFKLNPQAVGVMPLGRDSAGSPRNAPWDGVALAAFIDRRALATRQ